MRFSIWRDGKKVADHTGDVLFTHLGLSGPGILDASRDIRPGDVVKLWFRLPAARGVCCRTCRACPPESPAGAWEPSWQSTPSGTSDRKLLYLGIEEDLAAAHFSAEKRSILVTNCTEFPLVVTALGEMKVAMATRGGVALEGVSQKTMESKIVPGLFFTGEVLDIDGDTGGYGISGRVLDRVPCSAGNRKRQETGAARLWGARYTIKWNITGISLQDWHILF